MTAEQAMALIEKYRPDMKYDVTERRWLAFHRDGVEYDACGYGATFLEAVSDVASKLAAVEALSAKEVVARSLSSKHGDAIEAATFSPCRVYRYSLRRTWDSKLATVLFIGLNPSTADEASDDPTVRRCIGFAKRWGFGQLVLANLFAFRSTDPAALARVSDPIGPENDHWLRRLRASAEAAVVAWGANGSMLNRDASVLEMLGEVHCLGQTRSGAPRHPLYLASDTPLRRFN